MEMYGHGAYHLFKHGRLAYLDEEKEIYCIITKGLLNQEWW